MVMSQANTPIEVIGRLAVEGEVELAGTVPGLQDFADILRSEKPAIICTLTIPEDTSPKPYDSFLYEIQIRRTGDLLDIYAEDGALVLAGSAKSLDILASNVDFLRENAEIPTQITHHIHVEYYPDHFFLVPSALPMVISIEESKR